MSILKKSVLSNFQHKGRTSEIQRVDSNVELERGNKLAYAKKLPEPQPVYVVDLFCGCGGMSWGFANTRQSHIAYKILGGVDINETALATYVENIGALAVCKDIRSFAADPESLSKALCVKSLKDMRPLVFIGCPPCQGFSSHRKKDDRDDPRNDLSITFAMLCKYFLPDVIVMENVPEVLKGRFAEYFSKASVIFEDSGYKIKKEILDFSRYGVPQKRMRAVIVGALDDTISLPHPIFSEDNSLTVRQAIGHLNPLSAGGQDSRDPFHRAPSHCKRILELITHIPPDGGDRRSLPEEYKLRCHSAVDSSSTPGFTDVYGRLRWDSPAVTITAKSSTPSCGRYLHPEQHRNISVREAAILQGFPQDFTFAGSFVNQYRQIGEAVPPLFARCLAWHLLDFFHHPHPRVQPISYCEKQQKCEDKAIAPGLIDAFCGAGGLSLGFRTSGFEPLYAFDIDASAVETFNANLEGGAENADIADPAIIERISRAVQANPQFVIVGGPPCQGFSQQRRGANQDERNNLVLQFANMIIALPKSPSAIVLENVTYLDSPRGKKILKEYTKILGQNGFTTFRHDLNSADYGVPQLRRRILLVSISDRFSTRYAGPVPTTPLRWPIVGEFLCDLPDAVQDGNPVVSNHYASKEGLLNKRRIMFVGMGKGRLSIPDELQLDCHRHYGGHLDVYGRLDWFLPARTITGGFDSFTRGEFAHPFYHRSITPREAARIQGFPDWFVFKGSRAAIRHQIGNAVPPLMAFAVGKAIINAITNG